MRVRVYTRSQDHGIYGFAGHGTLKFVSRELDFGTIRFLDRTYIRCTYVRCPSQVGRIATYVRCPSQVGRIAQLDSRFEWKFDANPESLEYLRSILDGQRTFVPIPLRKEGVHRILGRPVGTWELTAP